MATRQQMAGMRTRIWQRKRHFMCVTTECSYGLQALLSRVVL